MDEYNWQLFPQILDGVQPAVVPDCTANAYRVSVRVAPTSLMYISVR